MVKPDEEHLVVAVKNVSAVKTELAAAGLKLGVSLTRTVLTD